MTERPILFSAAMVRAILDGRKTCTRRAITRNNVLVLGESWKGKKSPWEGLRISEGEIRGNELFVPFCHPDDVPMPSSECGIYRITPRIQVGDLLWGREAWAPLTALKHGDPGATALANNGFYRADNSVHDEEISRWRPSIHMPRTASRITLRVTSIKVERLQDISEADARAEGIHLWPAPKEFGATCRFAADFHNGPYGNDYRHAFSLLWESINGPGSWEANPYVVAIGFEVVK